MELNTYLGFRMNGSKPATDTLELPPELLKRFIELREVAEKEGREYGCNLYWKDKKVTCGETVKGTQQETPLDTSNAKKDPTYLGDFHVHPYRLRMHEDASIGPSTGDLEAFVKDKPITQRVGVNFVFANSRLHLSIVDQQTKTVESLDGADLEKIEPDFAMLGRYQIKMGVDHAHPFHTSKPSTVKEDDPGYMNSLAREKKANGLLPGYHLVFFNANLSMNRQFAAVCNFDYYQGEVKDSRTSNFGQSSLKKQPRPIWVVDPKNDSPSTGLICFKCNAVHSRKKSTVIGRWHRCRKCWTIYCTWCGDKLSRPVFMRTRERSCDRRGCDGGRTELID